MTAIIVIFLADSGAGWVFSFIVSDITLMLKESGIKTQFKKNKPQAL